jgi:hypothetical protein
LVFLSLLTLQVATPLEKYLNYTTRSTSQGVTYYFPEPEKVYRRKLNRLAPYRLLDSLGEEALSDIQFLFQHNNQPIVNTTTTNPNVIMSSFLRPLNFAAIQGPPPTQLMIKLLRSYLVFLGNNVVSV